MKLIILALPLVLTAASIQAYAVEATDAGNNVLQYVDPFIGTTNFGTTNPGAVCPNGMMSVSPFNVMGSELNVYDKDSRWWSTPYCFENKFFTGYSHVNLSGVGCPELGSLLTMATSGPLQVDYRLYGSEYTDERAEPGYYTNLLTAYGIRTEVTATTRTSAERYTFPAGQGNILLNLGEGLTNETGAMVRKVSSTEIEGMRLLGTFCYNPQAVFPIYFVMRVSKEPKECGFWKKQRPMTGVEADWTPDNGKYKLYTRYGRALAGDDIGYWFSFDTEEGEQIEVQVGVSFVSIENARENLDAEQKGFAFDAVKAAAAARWESDLSRIKVQGGTEKDRTIFYTGLYHALIHPNVLNDVNGEYPLMESDGIGKVPEGQTRYTVFSLWDTYRNLHQLMTLVYPERQVDMVRSMIGIYEEWGWMPKWELYGRETFTMEGDPAIPVIADSWFKGLKDFDIETAYKAFVKSADTPGAQNRMRPDVDPYISDGYIPLGVYSADLSGDNAVSHALEYYIADHALSLLADSLGHKEDAEKYRNRSLGYRHYYCPEYGTLRPLMKDGTFYSPFNPKQGENFETAPGFHEGSAWNYTFYVPHDVKGLAKLMGGQKKFVDKLQMVFDEGHYDPANEPDIAYAYLFSYFKGEEWRTQEQVARLLDTYYRDEPDGIPGNDDTGTMSAWAVFSMMGFYPDCPGEPAYTLTTPRFDRVEITLNPAYSGKDRLVITKEDNGKYISRITAGGKKFNGFRISHKDLTGSGEIRFTAKESR
ncbi:MAG: GH92 family glycosyl hydrolase [Bacteroidetes bacterium]|uniref:GH92 family glycosyl hydrolase n=1 Tax=Candidatus Cryptobacteroides merdavium TaxID=2840769 RepID=A0A9D9EAT5_9BACT|nr:GH92 family glycosyl hydrolase [Candidatus Cryptobacteroides merdavium]